MLKLIVNLLLILLIAFLQLSFLPTLGSLAYLNLALCSIIFITLANYSQGLWWALGAGFILDLYSPLPFGSLTLILLLTTILINFLFKKFFTHRTLPALLSLGLIATIFYQIIHFGFSSLFYLIKFISFASSLNKIYFITLFWQIISNLTFLFVLGLSDKIGLIDKIWPYSSNKTKK